MQSSMYLTAIPEIPVLVEIRSKKVSTVILSHPLSQLDQLSVSCERVGTHYCLTMEQCRSVNPFMPTRVFNPSKLTDRSVIIGSLVLLTAVIFIILQKLLYHLTKQCRPLSDIISFTICHVSTLDLHCLSNSFIWVLGIIGLLK